MLAQNVGGIDRILRIVVGLALIAGFFLNAEASMRWLYLIGIIPLATGLMQTCPLYSLIGVNTCRVKK
ncbi:YgaP family membrane protein [Roseinatronobacter sp.]|uniref:YgaP family membrane protein n=1 Tax=Roseinatronobacter sp. TaxID=1945755 RepID=UPI003F70F77B